MKCAESLRTVLFQFLKLRWCLNVTQISFDKGVEHVSYVVDER
jgi:hypothetical protein